jgi:hypothetical protein
MRPSYYRAVRWIAAEDDPVERDPEAIACTISVALVADLFGKTRDQVAADVLKNRSIIWPLEKKEA